MGSSISQVQTSQGNQPVNPQPNQANYSPAQQQMGGKFGPVGQAVQQASDQQSNNAQPTYVMGTPDSSDQSQPSGKGGRRVMYSPTSNQPTMGQPNPYPNTVGQWDNASIQPQTRQMGKGKGG